jgi:hypothetical protein
MCECVRVCFHARAPTNTRTPTLEPPHATPGSDDDEEDGSRGMSLDSLDADGCSALHVALLHAQLHCARICLDAGADCIMPCNGSPCLHLALAATGVAPGARRDFGVAVVAALVEGGASLEVRACADVCVCARAGWGRGASVRCTLRRARLCACASTRDTLALGAPLGRPPMTPATRRCTSRPAPASPTCVWPWWRPPPAPASPWT